MMMPPQEAGDKEDPQQQHTICRQLQQMFGHLHLGESASFRPTDFIDFTRVSSSLQQDVTEFLKMMLSKVEKELEEDPNPVCRGLVRRTFQGYYGHVTKCCHCEKQSERSSHQHAFHELQLFPAEGACLQDSLKEFLAVEALEGANQYHCEHCDSKQDAERSVQLRSLPSTLCLQLMRFQYDMTTGTKKKLRTKFYFPNQIDMGEFMTFTGRRGGTSTGKSEPYQLTGVLVHTGISANGGHYTAHINDGKDRWWRFDDDKVSLLEHDRVGQEAEDLLQQQDEQKPTARKQKAEVIDLASDLASDLAGNQESMRSSTNAYMLIYTKVSAPVESAVTASDEIKTAVEKCNETLRASVAAHGAACAVERERIAERKVLYSGLWPTTPLPTDAAAYWVDGDWLRKWVMDATGVECGPVDNAAILCQHQQLNPVARSLKRIGQAHWNGLVEKCKIAEGQPPAGLPLGSSCSLCVGELCRVGSSVSLSTRTAQKCWQRMTRIRAVAAGQDRRAQAAGGVRPRGGAPDGKHAGRARLLPLEGLAPAVEGLGQARGRARPTLAQDRAAGRGCDGGVGDVAGMLAAAERRPRVRT
jgi:ubiquitin carboxyl-terminal hydrolase 48